MQFLFLLELNKNNLWQWKRFSSCEHLLMNTFALCNCLFYSLHANDEDDYTKILIQKNGFEQNFYQWSQYNHIHQSTQIEVEFETNNLYILLHFLYFK